MRYLSVWTVSILVLGFATAAAAQETESTPTEVAASSTGAATQAPAADTMSQQPKGGGMKGGRHCGMHAQGGGAMMHGHHKGGKKPGAKGQPGHQGKRHGMMREQMMRSHHENMEARLRSMEEQLYILQTKLDQLLRRP